MTRSALAERIRPFHVWVDLPVVWGDMDAFHHINNTVFFRYMESARIAYLDRIAFRSEEENGGVGPILASTGCRFRRPLTYPDTVRVGARTTETAENRFTMEYLVVSTAQEQVAAEGQAVVVAYDYTAARKAPLPEGVRRAIAELERD